MKKRKGEKEENWHKLSGFHPRHIYTQYVAPQLHLSQVPKYWLSCPRPPTTPLYFDFHAKTISFVTFADCNCSTNRICLRNGFNPGVPLSLKTKNHVHSQLIYSKNPLCKSYIYNTKQYTYIFSEETTSDTMYMLIYSL